MMASDTDELELHLVQDRELTHCMRLRVQSLQQKKEKPQDGEKLLKTNEYVYRLDFSRQHGLQFVRWNIVLEKPGKVDIIGTSQNWTPDLTNLMRRQLLEPAGIFWKKPDTQEVQCHDADVLEFGERLVELAKVRKAMYFLLAFNEGLEPADIKCSVVFKV